MQFGIVELIHETRRRSQVLIVHNPFEVHASQVRHVSSRSRSFAPSSNTWPAHSPAPGIDYSPARKHVVQPD